MQQVKLRNLKIEDYDNIIKLWKEASLPFKPEGRDSKKMIKNQMEAYQEFFVGAFHGEKLVGLVIGSYDGRMKGWINRLAVDPKYRRRGIAQRLIHSVEKALEKLGATILCALIEVPNEESLDLFQKIGYIVHREVLYVTKRKSNAD